MENKQIFGYVYMVKNLINGKIYFGITEDDFDTRYGGDIAKHTHNDHLKRSIEKYGIENFEINEQFDIAYTEDDLYNLEDMYICIYNTLDPECGYNKRRSGSKCKGAGKHSEETRHRMSEAQKGKKYTDERKAQMSEIQKKKYKEGYINPLKGKKYTDEERKAISEATKKGIAEKGNGWLGRKHTEATKQKLREANTGTNGSSHRAIICIESEMRFDTIKEAGEWCGVRPDGALRGFKKTSGKHPVTKEPLHWMYCEDWDSKDDTEKNNIKMMAARENNENKVICIETGEVFKNANKANEKYKGHIKECCEGKRLTASDKHWMYYNDWLDTINK